MPGIAEINEKKRGYLKELDNGEKEKRAEKKQVGCSFPWVDVCRSSGVRVEGGEKVEDGRGGGGGTAWRW